MVEHFHMLVKMLAWCQSQAVQGYTGSLIPVSFLSKKLMQEAKISTKCLTLKAL